jgi:hypothetical protein
MHIIIKISTLYGIAFVIAMFVAAIIWVMYQMVGNPKLIPNIKNFLKKNKASDKSAQGVSDIL